MLSGQNTTLLMRANSFLMVLDYSWNVLSCDSVQLCSRYDMERIKLEGVVENCVEANERYRPQFHPLVSFEKAMKDCTHEWNTFCTLLTKQSILKEKVNVGIKCLTLSCFHLKVVENFQFSTTFKWKQDNVRYFEYLVFNVCKEEVQDLPQKTFVLSLFDELKRSFQARYMDSFCLITVDMEAIAFPFKYFVLHPMWRNFICWKRSYMLVLICLNR